PYPCGRRPRRRDHGQSRRNLVVALTHAQDQVGGSQVMTIQIGDRLPQATFRVMTADGPAAKTTDDVFRGRKVVLVAVPGAFTPTCDRNHLPSYVKHGA